MLILASLSGIQDFLFDVRESGGHQAMSLRYRSFRIQLIAECVAVRLLEAAQRALSSHRGGSPRLLFCAAAKVAIEAQGLQLCAQEAMYAVTADITRWLLNETHGRLYLSVAMEPLDDFPHTFERAHRSLAKAKLRAFAPATGAGSPSWRSSTLIRNAVYNDKAEADQDVEIGRKLLKAKWLVIERPNEAGMNGAMDVAGLRVDLRSEEPRPSDFLLSCSNIESPEERPESLKSVFRERRLARHIPRDDWGHPIEFNELASHSFGVPMLGVLKADVDSLGEAIWKTLKASDEGQAKLCDFSKYLDHFFSKTLEDEKKKEAPPWNLIYTVFSGGDDMLVVGPWNIVLDFAGQMRKLFEQKFGSTAQQRPCPSPLTISAGIAIIKPKYPIHLAAKQADDLLDFAKATLVLGNTSSKDQCATLGAIWKWMDHDFIITEGKNLADWVKNKRIQRNWLHTLLELTLLRRGLAGQKYAGIVPEVATSRLHYHIIRNWPRRDDPDEQKRAARVWIDDIAFGFDRGQATLHRVTLHLPEILRYAILATREQENLKRGDL